MIVSNRNKAAAPSKRLGVYIFSAWTVLVLGALVFSLYQQHLNTISQASIEAKTHLDLIIGYRTFIAELGGVYANTGMVAPNPYLKAQKRDVRTDEGDSLTLINPAYMTRLIFESIKNHAGLPVISKITSLKMINPANAPDDWERKALLSFEKGRGEAREIKTIGSEPYLRLMQPFVTDSTCLDCHGTQGYKEGDIRGGISISVPLKSYYASEARTRNSLIMTNLLVWLVGCVGLAGFSRIRQKQEQDIIEREWRFRTLSEATHDWEYWVSENNRIVYMSPSCKDITGYTPEEFSRKPSLLSDIVHPEDGQPFADHLKAFQDDQHAEMEIRITTKDGRVRWMAHECSPLYNRDLFLGRRVRNRDITEQKLAGEALLEQQNFAANLIRNSATATFVLDKTHRIMLWNRACEALTGRRESEMAGTDNQWQPFYRHKRPTVADIIIDNDLDSLPRLYGKYSRSPLLPRGVQAEGWFNSLGGKSRYMTFEAAPIYNQKGELAAAIETLQDVTESKKLEEQLSQSRKLESIGRLAGGVAHDFNNILSAIIGFAHVTLMKLPADEPVRGNIEQILRASERASALTQGLLSFSRKRPVCMNPLNLNDLVNGLNKFLLRLIREDIEIATSLAEGDLTVLADAGQLEQVLMNLVANASDAMPDGGRITIQTRTSRMDKKFIEEHGYGRPGDYALLAVSDTGEGMDAKTREKIFEPFFTTKEPGKGTGLGLAMAYGIAKQHNGYIDVDSEPGKGATFRVYLPLAGAHAKGERSVHTSGAPAGGSETILFAEDDTALRGLISTVLSDYGYSVIEASNGEDAVAKFHENRDCVRLLILDGIMPRKNGKEACREITTLDPSVKALFVSGYAEDILSRQGLLEPGVHFILKPIIPSTLLRKVREVLDA